MISTWMYVRVGSKRSRQSVSADELSRGRLRSVGGHKSLEGNLYYLKPPVLFMMNDPPPHLLPRLGRIKVGVPPMSQRLGVVI